MRATEDLNLVVTSIMIVGVIQASSQTNKNNILFDAVKKYATGHEVINFGCFPDDIIKYSYIEMSI